MNVTSYKDINEILLHLSDNLITILVENLIGFYLFGSLTYGDFNPASSDIDLTVIVNKQLNHRELEQIKHLHEKVNRRYKKWRNRLECSYTPVEMLKNILPPIEPRPYYGGGIFYEKAPYGNEWIINNYLLYQHGLPIRGNDFKVLIKPIDFLEVQKACIRDLFQEWEPKMLDFEWLDNSHYQSYLVMNLCRILYTVMCGTVSSKKVSAQWVKSKFCSWNDLITIAENWEYGKKMLLRDETINFLKTVIKLIQETPLYWELYPHVD